MHAMQVRIADRPPSTKAWKRELEAALAAIPTPDNEETMSGRKAAAGWLIASNGQRFQLNVGSYSLGRAPTCDFQLNDPRASRRHATIKFDGRQCRVVDEGSANGTFINEQPVGGRAVPLNLGERLRIGDTTLQFSLADSLTAVSMPVVLAPAVDELSGTVLESEPGPVSVAALRPPSAPVARSPAQQVPPAGSPSAAPPQKSGGLGWLWLSLSGLVIVLLLAAIGVLLYVQNNTTAAPAVNQQETALAQAFATGEAVAALTQTAIPGPTPSITPTPSRTAEPTATATRVQVGADTLEPSPSPTAPLTASPTGTAAATRTPTATDVPLTATFTPTSTPSPSPSPLPVAPLPIGVFQGFETDSVWKRGDEPNGELNRSSEQVHSGRFAGRLDYNFPTGSNDYVVFLQNRLLADTPKAMTVWVYGDGAGHFLNVWFKDAAGQTWQMSFGPVKHTGWQQMTAVLDPAQPWPSGHISGPNNGIIDYPIRFQGIVLDDGSDSFTGRGTIYIDDMATAKNTSTKPTPISGQTPAPSDTPTAVGPRLYKLAVGGQHLYEPWGAPNSSDLCESYRNRDFNDKIQMKGFNLELALTNNGSTAVPDNWEPSFITSRGKSVQACYYGYQGSGPQPGATAFMTFFTVVSPDDYVRTVLLEINGESLQICLDASGAQSPC